ncbi:hypothetical protein U1Q18_048758, partial [Sarracenia purpurea var. burkii]
GIPSQEVDQVLGHEADHILSEPGGAIVKLTAVENVDQLRVGMATGRGGAGFCIPRPRPR